MSDGRPTALIRDGVVEGYEDPPIEAPSRTMTPITPTPQGRPGTHRADDADLETFDPDRAVDAAETAFITARNEYGALSHPAAGLLAMVTGAARVVRRLFAPRSGR
jgi:hypothetical protein